MTVNASRKHLVLIGAGRAHLQVLKGLARQASSDMVVTLVAPHPYYIESTMVPGYVAGQYTLDDIRLPLDALVEASGVAFAPAHVLALDPAARRVQLSTGDALPYDVLSVDTEPVIDRDTTEAQIPGARQNALFAHPLDSFVQLWPQLQALAQQHALQVTVVADDLDGVELAMAAADALAAPHGSRVTLVAGDGHTLAALPPSLQKRLMARLQQLHITVLLEPCIAIDPDNVQLASGATLLCNAPVLARGAGTPDWLLQSGLQTTEDGQLRINERLQSDSHRQVFVVPRGAPIEVGPVLEANLRTALGGGSFRKATLAAPRLHIISGGREYAMAVWGPLRLEGREVWNWKDRRDRKQLASLFAL